jgi:hypothetical protein
MSLLAACGFDSPPVTNHEHSSAQSTEFSVGQVQVRNAYITTTANATSYLVVSLVNNGTQPDTLTTVTSPSGAIAFSGSGIFGGTLTIPPKGVPVVVNQPILTPEGPTATFTPTSTRPPQLGTFVPMQFSFASAGTSGTEPVPVIPPNETTEPTAPVPPGQATPPPEPGESASD